MRNHQNLESPPKQADARLFSTHNRHFLPRGNLDVPTLGLGILHPPRPFHKRPELPVGAVFEQCAQARMSPHCRVAEWQDGRLGWLWR